jgi:hypothetical protein
MLQLASETACKELGLDCDCTTLAHVLTIIAKLVEFSIVINVVCIFGKIRDHEVTLYISAKVRP